MNAHRTRGFTLIELLVVISIIALLVAILLPALGNARAAAQFAGCKSNIRQIGMGFHYYANDFNQAIPVTINDDNDVIPYSHGRVWSQFIAPYLNYEGVPDNSRPESVFACPSEDEHLTNGGHKSDYGKNNYIVRRTTDYLGLNPDDRNNWVFTVDDLEAPSETLTAGDHDRRDIVTYGGLSAPWTWWAHDRHNAVANALMFDNHVESWSQRYLENWEGDGLAKGPWGYDPDGKPKGRNALPWRPQSRKY